MSVKELEASMQAINDSVAPLIEKYGRERIALSLVACGAFMMGKHITPEDDRPSYRDATDATNGLLTLVYNFLPLGSGVDVPPPPGYEMH